MPQVISNARERLHGLVHTRADALIVIVVLLAFALRLYGLGTRTLSGDEYSSLLEGQDVGRNFQSLLYFTILHFWLLFGSSDFWVRFPSVLFGLLAIPASYQFGRHAVDKRTGLVLASLLAFSAFAIQYAQETRFYSLFLLTTLLSFTSFINWRKNPTSQRARLIWLGTSLLVTFSHLFGGLVPLFQGVAWWVSSAHRSQRVWRFGLILLCLFAVTIVSPLLMNPTTFSIIERLIGGHNLSLTQVHPRGLGLANVAKIPITLLFFSLGESQSALALPSLILGGLFFASAGILGLFALSRKQQTLILALSALLPLVVVFLVMDPAAPSYTETASARHVTMVLPAYFLLIAVGIASFRWRGAMLVTVGLVVFYSLGQYFAMAPLDWRQMAQFVENNSSPNDIILFDGRSADPVARYFDSRLQKVNAWSYLDAPDLGALVKAPGIVFISSDSQVDHRRKYDKIVAMLERNVSFKSGQVHYPTFIYVFEQKTSDPPRGYLVDPSTHEVALPQEIYGIEFQDLALPARASFSGRSYKVGGSFALPNLERARERVIPLLNAPPAKGLLIMSNVTSGGNLRQGEMIGEVTLSGADSTKLTFPLRLGKETQDWSKGCSSNSSCQSVLSWHKYFALAGQQGYEGAWSDFQANIFGTELDFSQPEAVESVTVRFTASSGQLHIWGMALR